MAIENQIRDFIANNLHFLESGLKIIKTEYPLDNIFGSKGYIDILAEDIFNNFVIIEIKRSQASSRETIQEILKYVGLIKQKFNARDSEIRILIISTHWSELLIPFSELSYQTTLTVKGIRLFIDNNNVPVRQEEVTPILLSPIKRSFARNQFMYLFFNEENRTRCLDYLVARCKQLGIEDYVLININCDKLRLPEVVYPFGICLAFQTCTTKKYESIIKAGNEEIDMQKEEFETAEEYENYLEQIVICAVNSDSDLKRAKRWDSAEACYPEKIDSIIVRKIWKVDSIIRAGIFNTDPRYNDELLIRELRGLDGKNYVKYLNFTESSQKERLIEIKEACLMPLHSNDVWRKQIEDIFIYLNSQKEKFRLVISIYSPHSVFDSINRASITGGSEYLPLYLIFIDFLDSNKLLVFNGRLSWNGQSINLKELNDFWDDNIDTCINKYIDCLLGYFDEVILDKFNMFYENLLDIYENGNLVSEGTFQINEGIITTQKAQSFHFFDWLQKNSSLKKTLETRFFENVA